jgi:hypothetical protein
MSMYIVVQCVCISIMIIDESSNLVYYWFPYSKIQKNCDLNPWDKFQILVMVHKHQLSNKFHLKFNFF